MLKAGMKVRLVGLGVMEGDERCYYTGGRAIGYVELLNDEDDPDVSDFGIPMNLKFCGPGHIGGIVVILPKD